MGEMEPTPKEHKHWPKFIKQRIGAIDTAVFISICAILFIVLGSLGFDLSQQMATTIFVATILGTLLFWKFRLAIALVGIAALLITRTLSLDTALHFMSVDVIIFLVGMMIIVEELEHVGFFKLLTVKLIRIAHYDTRKIMIAFMALSAFIAAFVDEVTSILIMSAMILDLCDCLKLNPVPYIISAVLATNIGSSATVMGNPVGILVALRAGLTFEEYLRWATPISIICICILLPICLLYYRKKLGESNSKLKITLKNGECKMDGWTEVGDKKKIKQVLAIFLGIVILIVLHHRIELIFGMQKNTILMVAPMIGAGIILIIERQKARELVDNGVDWWTLLFFMFLFAKAGALEQVGVTRKAANGIINVSGGNPLAVLSLMIWGSAICSGTIDNVPLIAALIPTVHSLGAAGIATYPLWWALVFGGCLGGNLTMVGSTANIVALGELERRRGFFMNFFEWFKIGLISVIVTVAVAELLILVQMNLMPL
jgi:Na+/H+ antiporter NhaD/arsenite permease-like protein